MTTDAARPSDVRAGAADVVQAVLALLPALVLVWPFGGPLEHDFAPRSTGFGLAALLAIPGALFFLLRRTAPSVRGSWLLAIPLATSVAWLAFGEPLDTFEAARATLGWALVLACLFLGAASDPRMLARGATIIGLCASAAGLASAGAGPLGNAGATSEAATLGAAAGAMLLATDRAAWRIVGAAAVLAFVVHAFRAPVLAGGVSLVIACGVAALARRGRDRQFLTTCAVIALAAVAAPILQHSATANGATANGATANRATANTRAATTAVDTAPTSGVSVRVSVHRASARLAAAHPLFGVGPGQFAAEFPPFREPAEIEASSHGRLQAAETEVEHAHDDWIQPVLELGLPVGLAWIAFALIVLREAWRALRSADTDKASLGAGLVALLVHALARAPITSNAASAVLFAIAAGAILVRRDAAPPTFARRFAVTGAITVLLAFTPRAWSLMRHGFALRPLATDDALDPERRERAIERAAALAPDSVLVRTLEARLAEAFDEAPTSVVGRWYSVLALRPHRIEAIVQLASATARAGQPDSAREALVRALELDPGNPPALQNLASLELMAGDLESGLSRLDRIPAARTPELAWLRGLAARLALAGLDVESAAITARAEPERAGLSPEERYALAKELRGRLEELPANGWEARAHRAWGHQHAEAARWNEAVRSLRQDLRLCLERPDADPVRVRLALAAALQAGGRESEAREQLAANVAAVSARDLAVQRPWTRDPLAALGVH